MNVFSLVNSKSLPLLAGTAGVLILMAGSSVQAAELLVPQQYATIQAGINAAKNGDTVIVANGTYSGTGNRNISFGSKIITVCSASDDPTKCIIDGQEGSASGFIFPGGSTAATVLQGFTVTNSGGLQRAGWNSGYSVRQGGGIYCLNSSPTITNCIISSNWAATGGGMYCGVSGGSSSSPTITNCTFNKNATFTDGAGIYNDGGRPIITNCTFSDNAADAFGNSPESSTGGGGGIWNGGGGVVAVTKCNFIQNWGHDGGAMLDQQSSATITNCAFIQNVASGDLYTGYGGGIYNYNSTSNILDCTLNGNFAVQYGGGIYNKGGTSKVTNSAFSVNGAYGKGTAMHNQDNGSPTIINCTFTANLAINSSSGAAVLSGPTLLNQNCRPIITNCIIFGNTGTPISSDTVADAPIVSNSDVLGGWGTVGNLNLNIDPGFVRNPSAGTDGLWFSYDDNYGDLRLKSGSRCINTANAAALPAGVTTDLIGQPRITGGKLDMGAYEYTTNRPPVAVNDNYTVYVGRDANLNVLANDSDPDNDALTITSWTQPAGYSITLDSTQKVLIFHAITYKATFTVTYTISDGKGGTATATAIVSVRPAPVQ